MGPDLFDSHPSTEDLQRLLLGELPEPELDGLARHLEQCGECQGRLSTPLPADTLIAALRLPLGAEAHVEEGECRIALARLSDSLAPGTDPAPLTQPERAPAQGPEPPTDTTGSLGTVEVDLFAGRLPCEFGRYLIQRRLGKGGMGAVYLARDTTLDRAVALKVSRFRAGEEAAAERFLREARAAADLHHEGVCRVLDCGVIDGTYYITMDYVAGQSLARRLAAGEAEDERWAAALVRQVALALQAVHERGIVHRDVKPGNIMLRTDDRPCVVDFGLARREQDVTITRAGAVVGTPAYMSPEHIAGEPVTQAADVYSLGVILYQLLTGRLPFNAQNLAQLTYQIVHGKLPPPSRYRPDLDPALEDICLTAMARSPEERCPTMAALAEALDDYLNGIPIEGAAVKRQGPPRPRKKRRRRLAAALGGRWWAVFFGLVLAVGLTAAGGILSWALSFPGLDKRTPEDPEVALNAPPHAPAPLGDTRREEPAKGSLSSTEKVAVQVRPAPSPEGPEKAPALVMSAFQVSRTTIYEYALKSVAWISTRQDRGAAVGSGALIDRDNRLVLTSYHVVHGSRDLKVFFPVYKDGKVVAERNVYVQQAKAEGIQGAVVAHDRTRDLALVQIERVPNGIDALPFARSEPQPGDNLHSVGNPGASEALWIYTAGQARATYQKQWQANSDDLVLNLQARVIEATSPTNPGDSGGPCVNDRGELVGITQGSKPGGGNAISLFIDRSEAAEFIGTAFAQAPQLKGKTWSRSQRPPAGGGKAERLARLASLLKKLESPEGAVRAEGAQGLALIGPDARLALSELVKALDDKDVLVRRLVAQALTEIGQPGPKDLPELLPALDSPSPEAKAYLLGALAVLGGEPEAKPAARAVLKAAADSDARVRQQALRAVGTMAAVIGDTPARQALEKGLQDGNNKVRAAAAESLTTDVASVKNDVPKLLELLKHQQPEVRAPAARALGRLGEKGTTAVLGLQAAITAETDKAAKDEESVALKLITTAPDKK